GNAVPAQVPFWHESFTVQGLPSVHAVPLVAVGFEQPAAGSQVPAVWHPSEAVQTTAGPPVQVPFWQLSPLVQALPSSQDEPLTIGVLRQTAFPFTRTHESNVQALLSSQTLGVLIIP